MSINDVITPQEDPAGKLAEFAANLKFEDIPEEHVDFIKKDILDMLGCLLAGSAGPSVPEVASTARCWASEGNGKVMVYGDSMPAPLAGFVNGVMARSMDMGDTGVKGGHVCEWIIPTLMTYLSSAQEPISGKQFITAFVAGAEWGTREHVTTHLQSHTLIPPGECAGSRYATTALAKLRNFDKEQIWNAAGMAFSAHSQQESQKLVEGTPDVRMQHGFMAEDALKITDLINAGLHSIHGIYMGHGALLKNIKHGDLESPDFLTDDLGKRWIWREGITQKQYTGCYYNHTPIWGVFNLMREHSIKREDIDRIHMFTSPGHVVVHEPKDVKWNPQTTEQALFSCPYALTHAIFTGDCFIDAFQEKTFKKNMSNTEFVDFMQKISFEVDTNITTAFDNYPITISLKDGREFSKVESGLPGNQANPLSWDQVIQKFQKCARYALTDLGEEKRQKAIEICKNMDKLDDIRVLFDAMIP